MYMIQTCGRALYSVSHKWVTALRLMADLDSSLDSAYYRSTRAVVRRGTCGFWGPSRIAGLNFFDSVTGAFEPNFVIFDFHPVIL